MRKILFVIPSLEVGGLQKVQITIANKLVEKGYHVTIMILDSNDELKSELDAKVRLIYKPYKFHIGQKVPYIRHKYYDDGMWETRATPEQLHEYYIGNEEYDVEIAFFRGLPIKIVAGGYKKKRHRVHQVKRLAWVHNDFRRASGYQNNFMSMREVHEAYKIFDQVVCVSREVQKGFTEVIGDTYNLTTIYNMLPVESIKQKALEKPEIQVKRAKYHLVLVGRLLDSAKGQKRLIDVVSRLHDEGNDISLALIGGGNDEDMLRNRVSEKGAGSYITMCGNQMNPYPYIREADLLVCASYFEGFNLTVAEALILGTPVLSTDCTGPNEILDYGKYGMIVENSENGLYLGIKRLIESHILLEKYREKANDRIPFFDDRVILKQIENLLMRS